MDDDGHHEPQGQRSQGKIWALDPEHGPTQNAETIQVNRDPKSSAGKKENPSLVCRIPQA